MADTPTPKVSGLKKIPPPVLALGAVGVVGVVWYIKKHKATAAATSTEGSSAVPTYIASEGAGSAGGGIISGTAESGSGLSALQQQNTSLLEIIAAQGQQDKTMSNEGNERIAKAYENILATLGTGGGAPITPATGVTVAPPAPSAPAAPVAAVAPPPAAKAPTRTLVRTGKGPSGETCHFYNTGPAECQHKVNGKWVW